MDFNFFKLNTSIKMYEAGKDTKVKAQANDVTFWILPDVLDRP